MKPITIPLLPIETTIEDALKRMERAKRTAVAAREHEHVNIIGAAWLLLGRKHGFQTIEEIEHRTRTQQLSDPWDLEGQKVATKGVVSGHGHKREVADSSFILIETFPDGTAAILPLSDEVGVLLETPADCYCTGPKQHSIPPTGKTDENRCGICNRPVVCDD